MPIESVDGHSIRKSQWHNPTPYRQKVRICMGGHWRNVIWNPGETIELDGQYDRAIQVVICQEDECNGRGPAVTDSGDIRINCQPCTRGHHGHIMGGQAPLLVRVGAGDIPNPALDPEAVERAKIADEARKLVQNQRAIKEALVQAQMEANAAEVAAAAPAESSKPAKKQPPAERPNA